MNRPPFQIIMDTKDQENHSVIIKNYNPTGIQLATPYETGWYIFDMKIHSTTLLKKTIVLICVGGVMLQP